MIIRCWGARGSIAVSGREYVKYGGDTPCIEIRTRNDEAIIIDAGTGHAFDIERDIEEMMSQAFAVSDIDAFREELVPGARLLYLGDNAGEIVFDTVLVRQLLERNVDVTYAVKSGPIINDATMADAEFAGMTELTHVIETGSNDIGVCFGNASPEFLDAFASADIVVGKGHGNFETCSGRPENVYFLLKAKCPMVADALGVEVGDIVFKKNRRPKA